MGNAPRTREHAAGEESLDHEVHVWLAEPGALDEAALREVLSTEERRRADRLRPAGTRLEFVAAHALLRTTLSRYEDRPPSAWRFVAGAYGRPEVEPRQARGLSFNLSHCPGLVACALTRGREVGIDVENMDRAAAVERLAGRVLAPEERAALEALPGEQRAARFFAYWTLKEAYVKARGLGLHLPLANLAFALEPDPHLVRTSDLDDVGDWAFVQRAVEPAHQLAVCTRSRDGMSPAVRWRAASVLGPPFA